MDRDSYLTQEKTNEPLKAAVSPVTTLEVLMFRLCSWLSNAYTYAGKISSFIFLLIGKCCYCNFPMCICTSKLVNVIYVLTSIVCRAVRLLMTIILAIVTSLCCGSKFPVYIQLHNEAQTNFLFLSLYQKRHWLFWQEKALHHL